VILPARADDDRAGSASPTSAGTPRSVHVVGNIQLDVLANPVTALPEPGGDTVIDRIDIRPAGAAGNVSLALHALGCPHRLFGLLGDDFAGQLVHAHLTRLGLAGDVRIVPGAATGVSIALEAPGRERAFWTAHGVLQRQTTDALGADCLRADLLVITGYFTVPAFRQAPLRMLGQAREAGAFILFDTGWDIDSWTGAAREEILSLLPLVDVFLPNEAEALALTGRSDPTAAARALHASCPGWVAVKLGDSGLLAVSPDGDLWQIPAPAVATVVDTTGAGDSLSAGLVSHLAAGHDVLDSLELGVRVASTVVGRDSTHRYPSRAEVLPGSGPAVRLTQVGASSDDGAYGLDGCAI
jgi:sugar/nucleoside kinase (ribokinase family)